MNFIKKKIKIHKKGHDKDDDFDNIAQNQPSSASEGISEQQSPPQPKDTEEWQFFQQLTQRVQDTVEKTQSTLTKLKDSSAIAEITKPDYYLAEPSENESKPLPQTAHSWVHFEEDSGDDKCFLGEDKHKTLPPPRPPLPKLIEADSFDLAPTTESVKVESTADDQVTASLGHSLLDEFGFQTESVSASAPSSVHIDVSTLLTLGATDEGPDPFDTSFVDTSGKILINNISSETKAASPSSKPDIDFSGLEVSEQVNEITEPDPFDTSFVDDITSANISRKASITDKSEGVQFEKEKSELLPEGATSSLVKNEIAPDDETMSNPFLSDSEPSGFSKALFDIDSQANDLFGAARPKSATNPFETGPAETADILSNAFGTAETKASLPDEKPRAAEQNLFDPFGFDCSEVDALNDASLVQPESTKHNNVTRDQFDIFSQSSVPASTSVDIFSQASATVSSSADIFSTKVSAPASSADIFSHSSVLTSTGADIFSQSSVPDSTGVDIFSQTSAPVSSNANLLEQQFGATSDNASEDLFSAEFKATDQAASGFLDSKRDSVTPVVKDVITSPEQYVQSCTLSEAASVDGNAEAATPQGISSMSRKTSSAIDELDDFFGGGGTQTVVQEKTSTIGEPSKVIGDPFATIFGDEPAKKTDDEVKDTTLEPTAFGTGGPTIEPTPATTDELATKDSEVSSVLNPFGSTLEAKHVEPDSSFDPFSGFLDGENKLDSENVTSVSATDAFNTLDSFSKSDAKPSDNVDAASTIADPFDTSMMEPEVVKDAIPFTETAAFEAFAAKFEEAIEKLDEQPIIKDDFDPFAAQDASAKPSETHEGFGVLDAFDPFMSLTKPPENTPTKLPKKEPSQDSFDDDEGPDFSVVIKPKMKEKSEISTSLEPPPLIPPPPKTPPKSPVPQTVPSKFNPFDVTFESSEAIQDGSAVVANEENLFGEIKPQPPEETTIKRTESQESPTTPLFDEDTSQPLEEFPQKFDGDGWEMVLRQPNKKKITGNRFWKKVYVRLSDGGVLQLFNKKEDNDPFQELPLQACYSLSPIGTQQFDAYGKIFTVKLQYIFYRERVGVRPGQISKVMQGHITSVGQIAKLGLPLEHAPQVSQLLKLGTQCYADIKTFVQETDDALFHLTVHRDRSLTYKTEEVQVTVQDEFYVEQDKTGHVYKQQARVRIFFLAFITGMPDVEVGLNDLTRQGKEVVGRYDIIPVVTEEWIRLENCEFHSCVVQEEFEKNRIVKLHPPDACLFELMRFRIRPPRNRELPLQIKAIMLVTKARVELRMDVLVPGYHSRKHGQVPCEDIQIRFAIPECWVYLFRVEKHFRYGSLKAAARRPGKIKGLERIMGTAQTLDPSLIEVSCGHAKYEHAFKSVVWRIPRLPKEGQGAYTTQLFLLRLDMTAFDQIPDTVSQYIDVEFTMPATTVSHTTVRSVSVTNSNPPEKYVRYMAKHEYKVEIEFTSSPTESEYVTAAAVAATTQPMAEIPSSEQDDDDDDSD